MRIYTPAGDLAFKTFTFPDGQPHFKLETYDREFEQVTIEVALKSGSDLLLLALVCDVLRSHGFSRINLDIRYLLGARMDRAISWAEPFTLSVVARFINSLGFSQVRILDAHSEVATRLIRNSVNVLPTGAVQQAISAIGGYVDVVIPDKGAQPRVMQMICGASSLSPSWIHQCYKERDPQTGALSNFRVPSEGLKDKTLLIVDDICDGGRTFIGLAKELRAKGAKSVNLFVTHGIFSKGLPLEGIDRVFTTDSIFLEWEAYPYFRGTIQEMKENVVVIPINMEKL